MKLTRLDNASAAQVSYLVGLYNEIHGTSHRNLSQCRGLQMGSRWPSKAGVSQKIKVLTAQRDQLDAKRG